MHLDIGVDGAAPLDRRPVLFGIAAEGTGRRRRIVQQVAFRALLKMEFMLRAVAALGGVLRVEVGHGQRHAHMLALQHLTTLPPARPMTMADPVPGRAYPSFPSPYTPLPGRAPRRDPASTDLSHLHRGHTA